jgi:CMP-N,N'-diacetyllegionaminic acid synthase
MISDRRVLAVVPARGGSKGIKLKNLREIRGRPLVAMAGDVLRDVPEVDRRVVSTDHTEIARVAREAGLDAPFFRPEEISGDRIGDWDVLTHALGACEKLDGVRYDIVVMVQPTSPLRTAGQVSATIRKLVDGGWDAVWTVSPTDPKGHPFKQLVVENDGLRLWDERSATIIARQQLTPVYHRNGVAYAMTRECLLEQKTLMGRRWGALPIEGEHISIDTEWDIAMVEFLLTYNETAARR